MTLISVLLRASVLLALVVIAHALVARRTSAATRHLMWTLAIIGLLLLPVLSFVLPGWTAVTLTASSTPEFSPAVESDGASSSPIVDRAPVAAVSSSPGSRAILWGTVLGALYIVGILLLLARLIAEQSSIQRLARRASAVSDPEGTQLLLECAERMGVRRAVRLLRSPDQTMPMTFGIWQGTILIPAVADTWSESRRRAVLLHELAHVARYDCLTQMLAAAACALYWIHPGVWWIARRLRVERELACDDCVLAAGTHAREYAGHLLEIAYTLGSRRAPAFAVSMAGSRQIEGRMLAVMDEARNRATPAFRSRIAGMVTMIVLLVPVAAATTAVVPPSTSRDSAVEEPVFESAQQVAPGPSAQQPGTWEIRSSRETRTVHLRLTDDDGSYGSSIDLEQLNGLPPANVFGAGGPVQFSLRRDAGAFNFEGVLRNGVGGGTYTFTPNAEFAAALSKRGFARPTPTEQYLLARGNVGFAFVDELAAQGYARPDLAKLIRTVHHGVRLDYVREMGQLGYRLRVVEELITLRSHGVSPQFIRELAAEGLKGLSADDLVRARSHGVSSEYVRDLRALGHQNLSLDALIRLRSHDVSPQYARELHALGYQNLPLEALIQLRSHGVSPEYVRELRTLGYQNLPLDTLIRLRNHGVSPEFVRELKDLGYDRLTIDELVGLRNHGVSPERIRTANSRAGRRLTVDALKSAAANGWR